MRTFTKASLIILCICSCAALAAVCSRLGMKRAKWGIIRACYRGLLRIIGVRVKVSGQLASARPLLLVTNHSTYLDVAVLGASLPARFCPKAEIASWPVIGAMCRVSECIFIDRRPQQTKGNRTALHDALAQGSVVCLFPEGTTGDGKRLLPFRSSYFSLAEEKFGDKPLVVQPAGIVYTHVCNMPVDSNQRHKIAWYGDMELVPHAAELLRLGPIRAELIFGDPVDMSRFKDRKEMAAYCQKAIEQGFNRLNSIHKYS